MAILLDDEVYTAPLHPYTQALLSAALPLHPSLRRQRMILPGEVPNPLNPPTGCTFNPRCPLAFDLCRKEAPVLIDGVACHAVNHPVEATALV